MVWVLLLAWSVLALAGCSEDQLPVERDISYGDDPAQQLDVHLPAEQGADEQADRAAVVVVHGGGWAQGGRGDVASNADALARAGFVAVNIDYRLPPPGQRWTTELDDVRSAVRWVQDNAGELGVDPARVGLLGSSAGGNLAMMVGTTGVAAPTAPPVRAVAAWSAPADLTSLTPPDGRSDPTDPPPGCGDDGDICIGVLTPETFVDYLGCTPLECPGRYRDASPTSHVSSDTPPMLLAAAESDFVPFTQVELMADALALVGARAVTVEVPGGGHAESLRDELIGPTVEFFLREL